MNTNIHPSSTEDKVEQVDPEEVLVLLKNPKLPAVFSNYIAIVLLEISTCDNELMSEMAKGFDQSVDQLFHEAENLARQTNDPEPKLKKLADLRHEIIANTAMKMITVNGIHNEEFSTLHKIIIKANEYIKAQ